MPMRTTLRRITTLAAALLFSSPAPAQCARSWVATPNGVTNTVGSTSITAMVSWDPDGAGPHAPYLVVAGSFNLAADVSVNRIAYWDGANWHAMGSGLTGNVHTLAVLNNTVYAGGDMTASGSTPLQRFAMWNGTQWVNAGNVNGTIRALIPNGNELFVAGSFTNVGGVPARYVARYTGSGWIAYANAPTTPVLTATVAGGSPVVFGEPDGMNPNGPTYPLSRWGTSTWRDLGHYNITTTTPVLGAVGNDFFFNAFVPVVPGPVQCYGYNENVILRVNTSNDGLRSPSAPYRTAASFATMNGQLWTFGRMGAACPSASSPYGNWIGYWNGSQWVDSGLPPNLEQGILVGSGNALFLGGYFSAIHQTQASNIAILANNQWAPLAPTINGIVRASAPSATPFIGGDFTTSGSSTTNHTASFIGPAWRPYADVNGPVTMMGYFNGNPLLIAGLLISGNFNSVNGTAASGIASYDFQNALWRPLGPGLNGAALCFTTLSTGSFHDDLIVGGQFTGSNGASLNRIARWSGTTWTSMPPGNAAGNGMNDHVRALANYNGTIYAGGAFTTAGGAFRFYIARWDGSAWQSVGGGMNAPVNAMLIYNNQLIVAGDFTNAAGIPCNHIAAYNGTTFLPMAAGLDGSVNALAHSGTSLLAAGLFTQSGSTAASCVAEWNGTTWAPVGPTPAHPEGGVNGQVNTISVSGTGDVLVGGSFTHAAGQYSPYAARALQPGQLAILTHPAPAQACPGGTATFTIDINPGAPGSTITYEWSLRGSILHDGTPTPAGTSPSGSSSPTIHLSNIAAADAGDIWVRITNSCGEMLLSNSAPLTVGGPTCPTCGTADFNHDGDTGTDADIEAFFACIANNCCPGCTADFDADGDTATDADIEAFFRVLAGGTC